MTTYALTAAPTDLAELVDAAVRDGEVVLVRDGGPVARLVRIETEARPVPRKRVIGTAKGLINVPSDFNEPLDDMEG